MEPMLAQIVDQLEEVVDTARVTTWDPLWAAVTVVLGVAVARIARGLARRHSQRAGLSANLIDLVGTVVMWSIITVAVVGALTLVGLVVTPLWLLLLFLLVGFTVGGRSLLESFGAGILLQSRAPFRPGDQVVVDDHRGTVVEVNSRAVVLDTVDGRRVYIPNSLVLHGAITNLTHHEQRMASLALDVVYGTDLDAACQLAEDAVRGLDEVADEPPVAAEVRELAASSVRIELRFWHGSRVLSEWGAVDAAARAVHAAYRDAGIEFAFPQQTLWWGDDGPDPA